MVDDPGHDVAHPGELCGVHISGCGTETGLSCPAFVSACTRVPHPKLRDLAPPGHVWRGLAGRLLLHALAAQERLEPGGLAHLRTAGQHAVHSATRCMVQPCPALARETR